MPRYSLKAAASAPAPLVGTRRNACDHLPAVNGAPRVSERLRGSVRCGGTGWSKLQLSRARPLAASAMLKACRRGGPRNLSGSHGTWVGPRQLSGSLRKLRGPLCTREVVEMHHAGSSRGRKLGSRTLSDYSADIYRFLGFSNGFAAACHDWTGLVRSVSRFSVCRSLEPICCGRTGLDRISPKCSRISGKPKMKRRVKPALKPRGNAKRRVELHRCKILGFWLSEPRIGPDVPRLSAQAQNRTFRQPEYENFSSM